MLHARENTLSLSVMLVNSFARIETLAQVYLLNYQRGGGRWGWTYCYYLFLIKTGLHAFVHLSYKIICIIKAHYKRNIFFILFTFSLS